MQKLKPFIFTAGVLLFVLSVAVGYFSIKNLVAILPASSYEDKGLYTFSPVQALPVQVSNTSTNSRERRMNPTKTVYRVEYQDNNEKGYRWSMQASTGEQGQAIVKAQIPIERRVLVIPADNTYITVEPEQSAASYTARLRQKYITTLILAGSYILLYGAMWYVLWRRKKRIVP